MAVSIGDRADRTAVEEPQAPGGRLPDDREEGAPHAKVRTRIGCHSFRATGITAYLRNGGKLEIAQQMANHESSRTTGLYDRRQDLVWLDEVERIVI